MRVQYLFGFAGVAFIWATACGGSTSGGSGSPVGGGGGGAAGSDATGGGGGVAGNAAGGKAGSGNGGTAGTGGATGGTGGVSCLDDTGSVRAELTSCGTDAECSALLVPTCCGSDRITGFLASARGTCTVPAISCDGLGCAKNIYPMTDDSLMTGQFGVAIARCESGHCKTRTYSADGGGLCGAAPCAPGQLCIHPPTSVGGPQPLCVPSLDGGACPAGTHYEQYCGGSGNGGCVETYVPPPPFCIDIPGACGQSVSCDCLPPGTCGGGADFCQSVSGHDVTCVNLAP